MSDNPIRENQIQNKAFLVYSQMLKPSVKRLWDNWEKTGGLSEYPRPSLHSAEDWCTKYQWVERAKQIHNKAKDVAVKKTVEEIALAKEEILAITRVIMIRYGRQLEANTQGVIDVADFEKAWKIQRIELGLPIEIGKQEVAVDLYQGVSDDELVKMLESLTKKYKERLKGEASNR